MKIIQRFASRLVAGAVALAVLGFASRVVAQNAQDSDPQLSAKILRVHGMARYSTDNQNWRTAKAGDILQPGTVIQTAEKSTVDLLLGERSGGGGAPTPISFNPNGPTAPPGSEGQTQNNVVRMFESSVLAIDKLTRDNATDTEETQLDLRAGRIMGNVKKLSAASKYEVKIPNGVAGIRGTVYMISSSGVVNVLVGSVVIAVVGSDGTVITKVVSAGYSWDPQTGQTTPLTPQQVAGLEQVYQELYGTSPTPPTTYTPPAPPGVSPSSVNVTPQDNQGLPPTPPAPPQED